MLLVKINAYISNTHIRSYSVYIYEMTQLQSECSHRLNAVGVSMLVKTFGMGRSSMKFIVMTLRYLDVFWGYLQLHSGLQVEAGQLKICFTSIFGILMLVVGPSAPKQQLVLQWNSAWAKATPAQCHEWKSVKMAATRGPTLRKKGNQQAQD